MPKLQTPEGELVGAEEAQPPAAAPAAADINREFDRAMASADPSAVQPPPRNDDAPPAPARRPRGRPRKTPEERARAEAKPDPAAEAAAAAADYTDKCTGLVMMGWAALAAVPMTTPYAVVIDANADALVPALNAGCQQNPRIRAAVERWTAGAGGVYMLQLAAIGTNMALAVGQLLRDPALRAEARQITQGKFRAFLAEQGLQVAEQQPAAATDEPVAA